MQARQTKSFQSLGIDIGVGILRADVQVNAAEVEVLRIFAILNAAKASSGIIPNFDVSQCDLRVPNA